MAHLLETTFPDIRTAYDRCNYMPTSERADIYLIRSHIAYWCGHLAADRAVIHASRGHSYRIDLNGTRYIVRIVDYYDHRQGIVGMM